MTPQTLSDEATAKDRHFNHHFTDGKTAVGVKQIPQGQSTRKDRVGDLSYNPNPGSHDFSPVPP